MNSKPSTTTSAAPKGSRPAKRAAAAAAKPDVEQALAIAKELAEAIAEPTPAARKPRTLAVTEGECTCRTCERVRPITKFPTKAPAKDGTVERGTECRECRDAARKAKNPNYPAKAA